MPHAVIKCFHFVDFGLILPEIETEVLISQRDSSSSSLSSFDGIWMVSYHFSFIFIILKNERKTNETARIGSKDVNEEEKEIRWEVKTSVPISGETNPKSIKRKRFVMACGITHLFHFQSVSLQTRSLPTDFIVCPVFKWPKFRSRISEFSKKADWRFADGAGQFRGDSCFVFVQNYDFQIKNDGIEQKIALWKSHRRPFIASGA